VHNEDDLVRGEEGKPHPAGAENTHKPWWSTWRCQGARSGAQPHSKEDSFPSQPRWLQKLDRQETENQPCWLVQKQTTVYTYPKAGCTLSKDPRASLKEQDRTTVAVPQQRHIFHREFEDPGKMRRPKATLKISRDRDGDGKNGPREVRRDFHSAVRITRVGWCKAGNTKRFILAEPAEAI
jgi:hypothetical protein